MLQKAFANSLPKNLENLDESSENGNKQPSEIPKMTVGLSMS